MSKKVGDSPVQAAQFPVAGGMIHPMYGMPIRDAITEIKGELGATISDVRSALREGDAQASDIMGDGKLQGSEFRAALGALNKLEQALQVLESADGITRRSTACP
jgi:hypothetical protein